MLLWKGGGLDLKEIPKARFFVFDLPSRYSYDDINNIFFLARNFLIFNYGDRFVDVSKTVIVDFGMKINIETGFRHIQQCFNSECWSVGWLDESELNAAINYFYSFSHRNIDSKGQFLVDYLNNRILEE